MTISQNSTACGLLTEMDAHNIKTNGKAAKFGIFKGTSCSKTPADADAFLSFSTIPWKNVTGSRRLPRRLQRPAARDRYSYTVSTLGSYAGACQAPTPAFESFFSSTASNHRAVVADADENIILCGRMKMVKRLVVSAS